MELLKVISGHSYWFRQESAKLPPRTLPEWLVKVWKWRCLIALSGVVTALITNQGRILGPIRCSFAGKEIWDYLGVFLVPFLIFASGITLDARSKRKDAVQRNEAEIIRQEVTKEQALQTLLDRVSGILLDKQVVSLADAAKMLGESYKDPVVESTRDVVRAQTLAILRVFSEDIVKKRCRHPFFG